MIFGGLKIALICPVRQQRDNLSDIIQKSGGILLGPRPAAIFTAVKTPIDSDLTHIVVEGDLTLSRSDICRKLNCDDLSAMVHVLRAAWVLDSIQSSSLLPVETYLLPLANPSSSPIQLALVPCQAPPAKKIRHDTSHSVLLPHHLLSVPLLNVNRNLIVVGSWKSNTSVLYKLHASALLSSSIILFDMDSTLIKPKSGKKYAEDDEDWMLFHPSIPSKLRELESQGSYLAIVSNQGRLKGRPTDSFQRKVDKIIAALGVSIDFICSIDDDLCRKPRPGMWEFLATSRALSLDLDEKVRLFVGDAAGRPREGSVGKDFSDSDFKFAINIGFEFQTPEKYFLGSVQRRDRPQDPPPPVLSVIHSSMPAPPYDIPAGLHVDREIVLLVAPPACGKSTLSRRFVAEGFHRVNQDELKSLDNCLNSARQILTLPRSQTRGIIVDNTNLLANVRLKWINLAREFNLYIRCIVLDVPKEVSMSLVAYRRFCPNTAPEDRRVIDDIVIHKFFKDLTLPSVDEGFDRVDRIPFSWIPPQDSTSLRLVHTHLI